MVATRSLPRLLPLTARRAVPTLRAPHSRSASSASPLGAGLPPQTRSFARWGLILALGGIGLSLIPSTMPSHPESDELETSPRATSTASSLRSTSTPALIRSYLVYTACSFPLIIDSAPGLLHAFTHSGIPGLKGLTEFVVRHTFFAQFVPGETVEECIPQMEAMRRRNVGAMLNYSAEADLDAAGEGDSREAGKAFEKKRLEEVYRALERAGEFEAGMEKRGGMRGSTCFALKIVSHAYSSYLCIDPDLRIDPQLTRRPASSTPISSLEHPQPSSAFAPSPSPHPPLHLSPALTRRSPTPAHPSRPMPRS